MIKIEVNKSEINLHIEGRVSDVAVESVLATAVLVKKFAEVREIPESIALSAIMGNVIETLEAMKKNDG